MTCVKKILLWFIAAAIFYSLFYPKNTKENFEQKKMLKNFYAPWCGYSKRLMPIWDKLTDMHQDDTNIKIIKVDCQLNPDIAKKNNINGFPTIILFNENGDKILYTGDRSLESLNDFIKNN